MLINEIVLPATVADDYEGASPFNSLTGIKKLNIFIGPNNSGKSLLLRELFAGLESHFVSPLGSTQQDQKVLPLVKLLLEKIRLYEETRNDSGCSLETLEAELAGPAFSFWPINGRNSHKKESKLIAQAIRDLKPQQRNPMMGEQMQGLSGSIFRGLHELRSIMPSRLESQIEGLAKKVYVPTLRGLRILEKHESSETYYKRTHIDYFSDRAFDPSRDSIFTGLGLFDLMTKKLLGNLEDRRFIRDFEEFLSKSFFDSQQVSLIPRHGEDTLHVKIGNEAERPITKLGDGVQHLIILTLPIFQYINEPVFLFIEEPDLFLHPGYQRLFINTVLNSKNDNLWVFATTHSNQFLDLTLETNLIAVFRCEKQALEETGDQQDPKFTVQNAGEANRELLTHIGVSPSSLMLANCTIWVEGITDRLFLGKYLQLYFAKAGLSFHENLHYVFVEYSGGNVTHWSFLDEDGPDVKSLCSKLILVADDDNARGKKKQRHEKLREALGERYIKFESKEIENTLTPAVIRGVIATYEEDAELNTFKQKDYQRKGLGKFIDKTVLKKPEESKRYLASVARLEKNGKDTSTATGYADSSGTIKGKVQFCKKALSLLNSYSDLSDEARSVTEKLAKFVLQENPK